MVVVGPEISLILLRNNKATIREQLQPLGDADAVF